MNQRDPGPEAEERWTVAVIERTGKPGEIVWDVDWNQYDLTGVMKLCIIDTGDGMTGIRKMANCRLDNL